MSKSIKANTSNHHVISYTKCNHCISHEFVNIQEAKICKHKYVTIKKYTYIY